MLVLVAHCTITRVWALYAVTECLSHDYVYAVHCTTAACMHHSWGVLGFEAEEQTRPQFYGKREPDATGQLQIVYPTWKRFLK
jgi:hypothetical protein